MVKVEEKRDLPSSLTTLLFSILFSLSLSLSSHQKETIGNNNRQKNWWLTTIIYRSEVKYIINWPHEIFEQRKTSWIADRILKSRRTLTRFLFVPDSRWLHFLMPSTVSNLDNPLDCVQKTYQLQSTPINQDQTSPNRISTVKVTNHHPSRKTSVHDVQEATRDDLVKVCRKSCCFLLLCCHWI